jgi:hypothetical protein
MKKLATLMAIGLAAISMAAHRIPNGVRTGEHLGPDSSAFVGGTAGSAHDAKIVAALKGAFAKDVVARVVVITAFQPDYAVGVKENAGAYRIFYDTGKRCELAIDADLGARLVEVWKTMLSQARPAGESPLGLDGATFHFSMRDDFHVAGGQIWSPLQGSKTWMFVVINRTMTRLCLSKDATQLATLNTQTDALLKQLQ